MKRLITLLTLCALGAHTTGCQPMHVDAQTTGSADAPLSNGGSPIESVYLAVSGKSGDVLGDVNAQGHEDWVHVLGWRHSMSARISPQSSAVVSARQHAPIVIEKRIDRASPQLTQAFIRGETLDWTMHVNRVNGAGAHETFYAIDLEDAVITGIETTTEYGVLLERISFAYSSITWTHADSQESATDSLAGGK